MKKVREFILDVLCVLLIAGLGAGAGYLYAKKTIEPEKEVQIVEKEKIVQLPGEVQKRVVTVDEVESKIMALDELTAYSSEYTITRGSEEIRSLLDKLDLDWTGNSIEMTATGTVKVGYDLNEITVKVDSDKIYISYPHAKLLDNYVIWDTVECTEKNNILNPIEFGQYQQLISEIEKEGLSDAEAKEIYDRADENLENILNEFLADFTDYEIVYM